MKADKILWVITGPTAVGKTDYAIKLATEIQSPIISADSRQLYNELNIGVAKPSTEQLKSVEHHFINHISIYSDYNAGMYAKESRLLINKLFETHNQLIVCGGTGLYINALLNGLDNLPEKDTVLRAELDDILNSKGLGALQSLMQKLNPTKFETMDNKNPQRLIRAIEIEKSEKVSESKIPDFNFKFETRLYNMEMPRIELYERINRRVDQMILSGLEEEVKKMIELQHLNALQTVGYVEWWPYFRGEVDLNFVIEKIKQHTRNYAKRQITWIRNSSKW